GIFNASGKDMLSILELVKKVAEYWKLDQALIKPIPAESLNQAAKRPKRTGFILDKAKNVLGYNPKSIEEGIAFVDAQLKAISESK
ncbi:MAG: sugar nucleotide-binding protein, partial [Daejeonella sp.]|nr:sugar nucleotide-binding protein [Daejeonella sp.]